MLMESRETILAQELSESQRSNALLQRELDTAITEALCATDALEQCAEQASVTLELRAQMRQDEAKKVAAPRSEADREVVALAQALLAAESALEAALAERDDLAVSLGGARAELAVHSNAGGIPGSDGRDSCSRLLEERLRECEAEARRGQTELVAERTKAQMLRAECLQSRAECTVIREKAAAEAEQLQAGLAVVRADNQRLTEELVASLLEQEADIETRMAKVETIACSSATGGANASLPQGRSATNCKASMAFESKGKLRGESEQAAQVQIANDEVERLRQGLFSAWAENELQAGQFVESLAEVQSQLSYLQQGVDSQGPRI